MITRKEILYWGMLIAIIFAIGMQIRLTKIILANQEAIETDPFAYAAKKYNLETTCFCTLDEERTLIFNQTGSWTRIERKAMSDYFAKLNISNIKIEIN